MCRKVTSAMKMINSMFEAENMDSKELSAKAKMLLASYRHVCWASIGFFRVGSEEQYMICDDDIDQALNYLVEFSPSEDKRVFESNLKALFDSKWMMELVDDAMIQVKEFPDMGEMYFELLDFAKKLEKATLDTIEDGIMTGDLKPLANPAPKKVVNSWEFIDEIASRL